MLYLSSLKQTNKTNVMETTELIKGQIYILTDEGRNKRFELKYINVSKRGYSFRNMKRLSLHFLQQHSVNSIEVK